MIFERILDTILYIFDRFGYIENYENENESNIPDKKKRNKQYSCL
jgi:hypothetical protein